jgi:hypothetical protein
MLKLAFGEDTRHRTQVSDFQNSELKWHELTMPNIR